MHGKAAHNGMNAALTVAFRGGAVTGLLLIGLGIVGHHQATLCLSSWQVRKAIHALLSLGFGGSLISVFARVGGGIYTRRPMWARISSEKVEGRDSRRTTLVTRQSLPTTSATMSAIVRDGGRLV